MLSKLLAESRRTIVFTGAGMSTESGLPDFRSADRGMWNNRNPAELASTEAMARNRDEFVRFYRWRIESMRSCRPNQGHRILADWERRGKVHGIITQNVDDYHEQAGTRRIAKLHGDLGSLRCMGCGKQYEAARYLPPDAMTACECGGFVRPNVVLFGERLPEEALDLAERWGSGADLLIVLGSSLAVSPANQIPMLAKRNGARLAIVNHDPRPLDGFADQVLRASIGEALSKAAKELSENEGHEGGSVL
ncbi:NAD-dependent deacylase [Paenibacillus methanolicus]|uniref:protein acetyllysine N-acetyltransferase n=1 Tax=Paenibacillus methanolicus TaxID=582686 RepID=A0A5S5CGL1_9BACL|nr:NAD-dependent deacylase [Paenibacillus methanolicus]TYP78249.1 NAD-dependent deacetylase [Paenibacillus methanolicus]